jgi:hypothetical protein
VDNVVATSARLRQPTDVWLDSNGNVYIADLQNNKIRLISNATGLMTTFAGGGTLSAIPIAATSALLSNPVSVVGDLYGNIYISFMGSATIRVVYANSHWMDRYVGSYKPGLTPDGYPAWNTSMKYSYGIAMGPDDLTLYYTDMHNCIVRYVEASFMQTPIPIFDPTSQPTSLPSIPTSQPTNSPSMPTSQPTNAPTSQPSGNPTSFPSSEPTIAPSQPSSIPSTCPTLQPTCQPTTKPSEPTGQPTSTPSFVPTGQPSSSPSITPSSIPTTSPTKMFFPCSGTISTVAGNGQCAYQGDNDLAIRASLNTPHGIYQDITTGNLYIADTENQLVRKVSVDGIISTFATLSDIESYNYYDYPEPTLQPSSASVSRLHGITGDSTGNIYVSDMLQHVIRRVLTDSDRLIIYAGIEDFAGATGDNGFCYEAKLHSPQGLFVYNQTWLYIADSGNHKIRKIDLYSMLIDTVIGLGYAGSGGDGGLVSMATLNSPSAIWISSAGDMYIAEYGGN